MTTMTYTDQVEILGSQDIDQLQVQANATQTQPLQTWNNPASDVLVQVTGDGRLELGNNLGTGAPHDALIQANEDVTVPTASPTSGWHTIGRLTGTLSSAVSWVVHELQLLGSGGVTGLQTAMRVWLTNSNTGTSDGAELRAADVQTINQGGSSNHAVGQATGLRATTSNAAGAVLTTAVAVEAALVNDSGGNIAQATALSIVPPINTGSINNLTGLYIPDLTQATHNQAIITGKGSVQFGDQVAIVGSTDAVQLAVRANPAQQTAHLQEWQDSIENVVASIDAAGAITSQSSAQFGDQVNIFGHTDAVQLAVQANSAQQTAHLQEWRDGSGNVLASINAAGAIVSQSSAQFGNQVDIVGSTDAVQLAVQANPAQQTAHLQEWRDGTGNVLASIDAAGAAAVSEFKLPTAAAIGQVLTSDADGQGTWQTPSAASPLTTQGDLYTYGTGDMRLPVGTNGQVLAADSTQSSGLKWIDDNSLYSPCVMVGSTSASSDSAQIVVPAWAAHPQAQPLAASTLDDEFNGSALDSKWSWFNQGNAVVTLADSFLRLEAVGTGDSNVHGIVQPIAGDTWTITMPVSMLNAYQQYSHVGLVLGESTSGKLVTFGPHADNAFGLRAFYWENATTYASTLLDQLLYDAALYLRIEFANANFKFAWSLDGYNYLDAWSGSLLDTLNVDQVGLMVVATNNYSTLVLSTDFFRVTTG